MGFFGDGRVLEDDQESDYWHRIQEFSWVKQDDYLVKVPLTPKKVPQFDAFLAEQGALRRYSVGANLAWIAWNKPLELLEQKLAESRLAGLVVLGPPGKVRLGALAGMSFARRVKAAIDPQGRWLEI
jgi:glycolate oxidase FAD binding subunit